MPPLRSEPASGSVRAKAANFPSPVAAGGKNFSFNSSLPKSAMGAHPSPLWADMDKAVLPQPQPSSSIAIAALTASTPEPPKSSGTFNPSRPMGPILWTACQLNSPSSSTRLAAGLTSRETKSWIVSCHIRCSSVRSKSMDFLRISNHQVRERNNKRQSKPIPTPIMIGMAIIAMV